MLWAAGESQDLGLEAECHQEEGEGDTGAEGGHERGVRVHSVRRTSIGPGTLGACLHSHYSSFWLMDRQEVAGERRGDSRQMPECQSHKP